jgi:hypothetical protein
MDLQMILINVLSAFVWCMVLLVVGLCALAGVSLCGVLKTIFRKKPMR